MLRCCDVELFLATPRLIREQLLQLFFEQAQPHPRHRLNVTASSYSRIWTFHSDAVSGMDLLITNVEAIIPAKSGKAKHNNLRNLAGPDDSDSATNGKMNDAIIAVAHTPALVAISLFF